MKTNDGFPQRVERGANVARVILVIAFRIALVVVFAPAALRALSRGDGMIALGIVAFAIGLGAIMAPAD